MLETKWYLMRKGQNSSQIFLQKCSSKPKAELPSEPIARYDEPLGDIHVTAKTVLQKFEEWKADESPS